MCTSFWSSLYVLLKHFFRKVLSGRKCASLVNPVREEDAARNTDALSDVHVSASLSLKKITQKDRQRLLLQRKVWSSAQRKDRIQNRRRRLKNTTRTEYVVPHLHLSARKASCKISEAFPV